LCFFVFFMQKLKSICQIEGVVSKRYKSLKLQTTTTLHRCLPILTTSRSEETATPIRGRLRLPRGGGSSVRYARIQERLRMSIPVIMFVSHVTPTALPSVPLSLLLCADTVRKGVILSLGAISSRISRMSHLMISI
jgi:hypothetical protein